MSVPLVPPEKRLDFLQDFTELSQIGATSAGGVDRQAATEADGKARRWLGQWFESHGMQTAVDNIGNLFGLVTFDVNAPYILAGSHLDSQPTAGRLDGAYGVLAAAHAAESVRDAVAQSALVPRANLAVVDWFNEEGSRFAPSIMGSGVYTHKLDLQSCLSRTDDSGTTVQGALETIGYLGSDIPPRAIAYAEIHVEQGRVLESTNIDIGLVSSNWAVCKFEVTVEGEQAHTGTADLLDRRDALVAAARVVLMVSDRALAEEPGTFLASVGKVTTYPNVPGVVASRVVVSLDVRATDAGSLQTKVESLKGQIRGIANSSKLEISIPETVVRPSMSFPESGIELAAGAALACNLSHSRILTRAGHDAIYMNDIVPTVMTFIPSKNGASHSEAEDTAVEDLVNGVNFFSEVLARLVSTDAASVRGT